MNLIGAAASDEALILRLGVEIVRRIVAGEPFECELTARTAHLFDADGGCGFTSFRHQGDHNQVSVITSPNVTYTNAQGLRAARHADANPEMEALFRSRALAPVRTSDLVCMEEFWETEVFAEFHGWVPGARFPLGAALHVEGRAMVFLGMHRSGRDFSEDDIRLFWILQQLLAPALTHRIRLAEAVERLETLGPASTSALTTLTRREKDVLALAAQGLTSGAIGHLLGITERAVRKHLTSVYAKTGTTSRAAAATWWAAHRSLDARPANGQTTQRGPS